MLTIEETRRKVENPPSAMKRIGRIQRIERIKRIRKAEGIAGCKSQMKGIPIVDATTKPQRPNAPSVAGTATPQRPNAHKTCASCGRVAKMGERQCLCTDCWVGYLIIGTDPDTPPDKPDKAHETPQDETKRANESQPLYFRLRARMWHHIQIVVFENGVWGVSSMDSSGRQYQGIGKTKKEAIADVHNQAQAFGKYDYPTLVR